MLDSGREYLATSMVTMKKMRSRTLSTLRRKVCSLQVTVVSVFGHLKLTELDKIGIDSPVQRIREVVGDRLVYLSIDIDDLVRAQND